MSLDHFLTSTGSASGLLRGGPRPACGCPKSCRGWSGGLFVFVDEAIAAGRSDGSKGQRVVSRVVVGGGASGRSLVQRAVGPVHVVVRDVVDHETLELALVPDDGSVEELASQSADPAFGERVRDRRPDGCLENLEALATEDLVEVVDELAGAVSQKCSGVG